MWIKMEVIWHFNAIFYKGFYTTTQLLLNEIAEVMLDSEDYRAYINYDKRAVFRPIGNAVTEQDELEYGDNKTGNEI